MMPGGFGEAGALSSIGSGEVKIRLRASKRQSLTKTLDTIDRNFPTTNEQLSFCISKLKKLESEIGSLDCDIETYMLSNNLWDDAQLECQSSIAEEYSDRLGLTLCRLNAAMNSLTGSMQIQSGSLDSNSALKSKLRLPDIELPGFDNNPENYTKFINDIEKILEKFELTEYEKFSYLKKQLSGPAREIVDSIPFGDFNYTDAKKLLYDAFADKTAQQFSVINKFLNLQSLSKSNLYSWISEIRILTEQLNRLEISSDIFAQFFIWNSLSEAHKQLFISITNKSKPNLQEIMDKAFEVINRIKDSKSFYSVPTPESSISLATGVTSEISASQRSKFDKNSCWLCQNVGNSGFNNHKIYKCPVFSTPEMKKNKIIELNGCTRCGFLNHKTKDCKFKFSGKCRKCQKFHAYFLCSSQSNAVSQEPAANPDSARINPNIISVSSSSVSNSSSMIVPTFTSRFISKKKSFNARVLYDPASQCSFVSECALGKLPHKVIKNNVKLNISGFNTSKEVVSKVVELTTKVNGTNLTIEAVVAPKINASVANSAFSDICKVFKTRNIKLADDRLQADPHVDILLGLNASADFPVYSLKVGVACQVFYSPAGVMLAGDVGRLLGDVDFSAINSFISKIKTIK